MKEDEVIRDFSQLFCPAKSEKTRKSLFWLPATDEQVAKNEKDFAELGFPVVQPNSDFMAFINSARPLDRKDSNQP